MSTDETILSKVDPRVFNRLYGPAKSTRVAPNGEWAKRRNDIKTKFPGDHKRRWIELVRLQIEDLQDWVSIQYGLYFEALEIQNVKAEREFPLVVYRSKIAPYILQQQYNLISAIKKSLYCLDGQVAHILIKEVKDAANALLKDLLDRAQLDYLRIEYEHSERNLRDSGVKDTNLSEQKSMTDSQIIRASLLSIIFKHSKSSYSEILDVLDNSARLLTQDSLFRKYVKEYRIQCWADIAKLPKASKLFQVWLSKKKAMRSA